MPDGDYLAWRAGGKWRKVANLMKSQAPMIEIEDAVASAVANSIRSSGGVPQFQAVVDRVCGQASNEEPSHDIGASTSASPGGVLGRVLDEVAQALATTMQTTMNLVSPAAAAKLLARRLLARIAVAGLDHAVPALVSEGRFTAAELRAFMHQLTNSPPMTRLVDRFLDHPSGVGLRAPDRRTAIKPMDELMDTNLDEL
jgi:hypothetical protein